MLSKNNFKERLKKMELRKERFSIRKLSVGAASVLIGFFFINSIDCQHVQAAEQEKVISESSSKIADSTNNQKIKTNLTNINTQETSENKKTESSQNYKDMKSDDVAQKSNEKQSNSATTLNSYPNILNNKEH